MAGLQLQATLRRLEESLELVHDCCLHTPVRVFWPDGRIENNEDVCPRNCGKPRIEVYICYEGGGDPASIARGVASMAQVIAEEFRADPEIPIEQRIDWMIEDLDVPRAVLREAVEKILNGPATP